MKKNDTLLIVEDEENILYGMQSVLSCHLDFISEVYTARNGKEALTIIQNKPVSMIVTDLRMPVMDGTTMIKNIRKMGYQMPVIVLTAIADFKKAQELIPLKIQNYVLKPFSVEDILKEIDNAFCELREKESLKKAEKLLEKFPELRRRRSDSSLHVRTGMVPGMGRGGPGTASGRRGNDSGWC